MEKVILVNQKDEIIGTEEKMKAHRSGKLHRAFSIILFNKKGEVLIQKRAKSKYHSPGLWTNTCCSHPRPREGLKLAAERRLKEEMGINCKLKTGMVIAIEPMLTEGDCQIEIQPDGWTVITKDRKMAAHWEHSIAILPDGPRILSKL